MNVRCEYCNKAFRIRPSKTNITNKYYCSKDHFNKYRTSLKIQVYCLICNKIISRASNKLKNKNGFFFCSKSHKNEAFKEGNPYGLKSIENTSGIFRNKEHMSSKCTKCNRTRHPNYLKEGLCSQCFLVVQNIKMWLEGDLSVTYSGKSKEPKKFLKEYLLETRGSECNRCSKVYLYDDGSPIIDMNHIDGNYLNNSIENLEIICPVCHRKTDTWGSRNKKLGRRRIARQLELEAYVEP